MILDYFVSLAIYMFIYFIVVAALNLSIGFAGLVNLGHMVAFGIGAYASALFMLKAGFPWFAAILAAAITASLISTIIAAVTVRLKGDYYQIVTLGLVFMAIALSRNWTSLTRGALGIPGVPQIIKDDLYYMLFVAAISSLCLLFFYRISKSETGKAFQAIRDDEVAAQILGKNTYGYKVLCILISTFFTGLAGALLVHHINFIDPSIFDLDFFVIILAMTIVGGLASIPGSIAGVFSLSVVMESLRFVNINPEIIGALRQMLFLLILLIIVVYRPRGILGKVDV